MCDSDTACSVNAIDQTKEEEPSIAAPPCCFVGVDDNYLVIGLTRRSRLFVADKSDAIKRSFLIKVSLVRCSVDVELFCFDAGFVPSQTIMYT
ncbi:MAG TPA: hypothetical protein V6C86_20385 [Oculatellaceae cyanobacterium]